MADMNLTGHPMQSPEPDTSWIDGVRGISCLCVVISHLVMSFAHSLIWCPSEKVMLRSLWHWPFIRAPFEGFPWVAIFLTLTAVVNGLKPIKYMMRKDRVAAMDTLAFGACRRSLRLIIPCTAATAISFVVTHLGGYNIALSTTGWLAQTSPAPAGTFGEAVAELLKSIYTTWTSASNYYDMNQWPMVWFLRCSMTLYFVLFSISWASPPFRRATVLGMAIWSWACHDDMVGIPTYGGILFAELILSPSVRAFAASGSAFNKRLAWSLLIFGWYLISFPNIHPEYAPWYSWIYTFGKVFLPFGSNIYQMVNHIGVTMILASCSLSETFQAELRHPILLWIGGLSFPIYLLHGVLLRSYLCFFLFVGNYPNYTGEVSEDGTRGRMPLEPPAKWRLFAALPVFFATLFWLAHQWMVKVEPIFGALAHSIEEIGAGKRTVSFVLTPNQGDLGMRAKDVERLRHRIGEPDMLV